MRTVVLIMTALLPAAALAEPGEVHFERHVAALLGRLGCNAGSCHGSFQGKGGLRLSLFGASPDLDYAALTRDGLGRRIQPAEPERSLLLLKPTAQVPHEGGERFARGSWEYRLLRDWIARGAPRGRGSSAVRSMDVQPAEHCFSRAGECVRLRVTVEFDDSSREDVTRLCDIRPRDESVAAVANGEVTGLNPGDTALVVSYRGHLRTARVLVPGPAVSFPPPAERNYVDREVFAKLRQLNLVPSEPAGDAEFLRRVMIDTVGRLPPPDEVRAFLADPRPDKRERKIDELLAHPLHAALWATKFCDITGNNLDTLEPPAELRPQRAQMWHAWFRKRLAENVPYDELVRGVLCATSRDGQDVAEWVRDETSRDAAARQGFNSDYAHRPSLDLFWRRSSGNDFFPLEQMAELTASAFLGVRLACAQCHKHPYDRWTQADYRAFANVFARVKFDSSPEVRAAVARLLEERRQSGGSKPPLPPLREIYLSDQAPRRLPHPETNAPLPARALGGPELSVEGDARLWLFQWLARPDNPYFARSLVNRVWAHYLGVGLVEPVDNFSAANPPSNAGLLDALADDFTAHGYDLRRLEWVILTSRTYQLSALPNATNGHDRTNYSHALIRRPMAEVVLDMLNSALETAEDFGADAPPGARAVEVAASRLRSPQLNHVFRVFGRPARTTTCDCERSQQPALPQTLFLMTDEKLLQKLTNGRLARLLKESRAEAEVLEELFLATLSRFPTGEERRASLEYVQGRPDRRAAWGDVVWALVNTREFILNH